MTGGLPTRSPWLEQLRRDDVPCPLDGDHDTDVVVVGAGIAGASTAFFVLRETDQRVLLVERERIGNGATGHNAGQLATYFERPLADMAEEYGLDATIDAQKMMDGAWELIELIAREIGTDQQLDRFTGNMGMFNLDHVVVHLRQAAMRRDGGLRVPECFVSEQAPFLLDIPAELTGLYTVVPDSRLREVLGPGTERYCAVLCSTIGAANGALLVERIIDHLRLAHPHRFRYVDRTKVDKVVLHADRVEVVAGPHTVRAARVVMCTNGFADHELQLPSGEPFDRAHHRTLIGTKGYMVGTLEPTASPARAYSFIRNERIGDEALPYLYVTRRRWSAPGGDGTLMVFGGPEEELEDAAMYDAAADFPAERLREFEDEVMSLANPAHVAGAGFDFQWHGLMGYTQNRLRLIGAEPRNPVLLYNLGCNGVGFMPSIVGGHRVARVLAGDAFPPSIFDPPA
jgi:glycine/D-amino acid oxidase-like deaminating enzyme